MREFLTTSLPNRLIEALLKKASAAGFTVLSLDSVRAKLETAKAALDGDARLFLPEDVKAIIMGQLESDGKLTVQLVDAETGQLLWSKPYQLLLNVNLIQNRGTFGLLTSVQAEIVNNVFDKLAGK